LLLSDFAVPSVLSGLYMSASTLYEFPGIAFESWRAFSSGSNVLHEPTLYPDDRALRLFINDSWALLDKLGSGWVNYLYENPYDSAHSQPVCRPLMTSQDGLPFETGCTDPDYPSMYFPPQCYPNPRRQCALVFAVTPEWIGTQLQGQIQTLNLSLGIAVLNAQVSSADIAELQGFQTFPENVPDIFS
jgi:hypothetical protein